MLRRLTLAVALIATTLISSFPQGHEATVHADEPAALAPSYALQEIIQVPVNGDPVLSSSRLQSGVVYQLRASGATPAGSTTVGTAQVGGGFYADPEYAYNLSGSTVWDRCQGSAEGVDFGIGVDDVTNDSQKSPTWGTYNASHVYTINFTGTGQRITLNYHDCDYSDNWGSLTVEVLRPVGTPITVDGTPFVADVSPTTATYPVNLDVNHQVTARINALAVSSDGSRLYAGTDSGVWRSDNHGMTWRQLDRPQPASGENEVPGALGAPRVYDVAVSPFDPDLVLVPANGDNHVASQNGVYRSTDGGDTWTLVHQFNCYGQQSPGQVIFAPDDRNLAFAAGGCAIARSLDGGATWTEIPIQGSVYHLAITYHGTSLHRVYGLGPGQMWFSQDDGLTWYKDQGAVPPQAGGPMGRCCGNSAQVLIVEPGTFDHVMIAVPGLANGPSYWRNQPTWDDDGSFCNTPVVYDSNGSKSYDAGEPTLGVLTPKVGQALLNLQELKYQDINGNNHWDPGEPVAYDANLNNQYDSGEPKIRGSMAANTPLSFDLKIRYADLGRRYGVPCADGSLWMGDFSNVVAGDAARQAAAWSQLPGPAVYRSTNSGNVYLVGLPMAVGYLLFFSDLNHVFVANNRPTGAASWHHISGKDASQSKLDGQNYSQDYVHLDPHALAVTPDFVITLKPPTGVSYPYDQNSILDHYFSGEVWMANDGGVYHSGDGGATWQLGAGLHVIGPINVAGVANQGKPPGLYYGVGDDDDFYSLNGGSSWGDPVSGCGDCDTWFADPAQPTRVLEFTPRESGKGFAIYQTSSGYPDAGNSSQRTRVVCPDLSVQGSACSAVSSVEIKGYRPIIQTLQSESPLPDGDYILIYTHPDGTSVLLRTTQASQITSASDWAPPKAVQQGPDLPAGVDVAQAAGGHTDPVFYVGSVGGSGGLWKWKAGMTDWQPLVPAADGSAHQALRFFANPYNPNEVYLVDTDGIKRSDDGGVHWQLDASLDAAATANGALNYSSVQLSNEPLAVIKDILFDRREPGTRFAMTDAGIFYAVDGRTWRRLLSSTATPGYPFSGYFDPITDPCDRALYVATNDRGLLRISPIPNPITPVDVSAIAGIKVNGPLTSWQTPNGPYNVEHLAGPDPNGDLITFYWSPAHDWQAVNVSQIAGYKVAGPVTSWQTPNGPYNVEHLAGPDPDGDLITFWWSPTHDWQAVNVSQIAGYKVAGPVTSWQTPNGTENVEHLAGMAPNGDLITFWWSPSHDWQAVDVSQIAGYQVAGPVTSWQTPNGPYTVEHLAGMAPNGDLITFWWSPAHDWQAVNVSQIAGYQVSGAVTSWQTTNGPYNVEHLAGRSPDGDLITFWWSPAHDWQAVNVSQITGKKIAEAPVSWQTHQCRYNVEHLAAPGPNGEVFGFWWSPLHDWQAVDMAGLTGHRISTTLTAWQTPNGPYNVEHLAGMAPNGDLELYYTEASDNLPRDGGVPAAYDFTAFLPMVARR